MKELQTIKVWENFHSSSVAGDIVLAARVMYTQRASILADKRKNIVRPFLGYIVPLASALLQCCMLHRVCCTPT